MLAAFESAECEAYTLIRATFRAVHARCVRRSSDTGEDPPDRESDV